MASGGISRWLRFQILIFVLLVNWTCLPAKFIGKDSCHFGSVDVLTVNSKMWFRTGSRDVEAETNDGNPLKFPRKRRFKVNIKAGALRIERLHPNEMLYNLPNIYQLRVLSGDLTASCIKDRREAEIELGVKNPPLDLTSTLSTQEITYTIPTSAVTAAATGISATTSVEIASFSELSRLSSDATSSLQVSVTSEEIPVPETSDMSSVESFSSSEISPTSSIASSSLEVSVTSEETPVPGTSDMTSDDSSFSVISATVSEKSPVSLIHITSRSLNSTVVKDATSTVDKAESVYMEKHTTKEAPSSAESVTPDTTKANTITTTSSTTTTTTTRRPKPVTVTILASLITEEEPHTKPSFTARMQMPSLNTVVPQTSEVPATPVRPLTGEVGSQKAPIISDAEEPTSQFRAEDHIPYFAASAILVIITVIVVAVICIVKRRRSRRHPINNHEELFITSTYDEMLLRNNERLDYGSSSRVIMYGGEPLTLDARELEDRVLATTEVSAEAEKPKCLAN